MSSQLVVNPRTVSQAYQELEREGVVYFGRGQGTFVSPDVRAGHRVGDQRELIDRLTHAGALVREIQPLAVADAALAFLAQEQAVERHQRIFREWAFESENKNAYRLFKTFSITFGDAQTDFFQRFYVTDIWKAGMAAGN